MACNLNLNNPGSREYTGTIYNIRGLPDRETCDSVSNTIDDLWCNNLCGNDVDYYIPVIEGQKLLIQTRFFDDVNFGPPEGNGNDCENLPTNNFRLSWRFQDNGYPNWGQTAAAGNLLGITIEAANFGPFQTCQARLGGDTDAALIAGVGTPSTSLSDYMTNKLIPFYTTFYNYANGVLTWTPSGINEGVLTLQLDAVLYSQAIPTIETCEANEWGEGCDCIDAFLQSRSNPLTLCDDEWLYWCPMNHRIGATYLVGTFPGDPDVTNQFITSTWEGTECCCEVQEEPANCLSVGGGCGIAEGRALFEVTIPNDPSLVYGTANQDVAEVNDIGFVIFLDNTPCNAIDFDDVPPLQTLGQATDYNDFLNNVLTELTNFWTAIGTSTVSLNGDTFTIEIDIDAYNTLYGTEVCEDNFRVCTYSQDRIGQGEPQIVCDVAQDFFEFTVFFERPLNQINNIEIGITNDCGNRVLANLDAAQYGADIDEIMRQLYFDASSRMLGNSYVYPVDIPIYHNTGPYQSQPQDRMESFRGLRFHLDLTNQAYSFLCCQNSQTNIYFNPNPSINFQNTNDALNQYAVMRPQDEIADIWTCCQEPCPNENGFVNYEFDFGHRFKDDLNATGQIDGIKVYLRTTNNIWSAPLSATYEYSGFYSYNDLNDLLNYFMFAWNVDINNWNNGTPAGYVSRNGTGMRLHFPTASFPQQTDCTTNNFLIFFNYVPAII